MEIKKQIQDDAKGFLKSRDVFSSGVLRLILASIISKEKEKRYKISKDPSTGSGQENLSEQELIKKSELTNDEVINTLLSEIKKRKDAIVLYERGNRQELADKEKEEIEIIKKYLPEQIPTEELKKIIEETINKVCATEIKDTGKIMADLMPRIRGRADNSEVSKIIKVLLQR